MKSLPTSVSSLYVHTCQPISYSIFQGSFIFIHLILIMSLSYTHLLPSLHSIHHYYSWMEVFTLWQCSLLSTAVSTTTTQSYVDYIHGIIGLAG